MTKILILGGAGFIGCNLVRRCLAEPGNRITVVDSLDPRLESRLDHLEEVMPRIELIQGDIRDERLMAEQVKVHDLIFNCAAQTSHPMSLEDPLYDAGINCLGNLHLLESVRAHNPAAVIVYPSTTTIVGRAHGEVTDEEHGERPLDIYSANKGVAEKYYRIYHMVHDLQTMVLRFSNLYGPYGKPSPQFGFLNYFIDLAWNDREVPIFGDGSQLRNVMFVRDAVDVLYRCAFETGLRGETHLAVHEEHFSVRAVAESLIEVFGRGRIVTRPWPDVRRRIEIQDVALSARRLRERIGWRPKWSLREGLAETRNVLERAARGR